jgi:predicted O-methyltransferase YrrM
MFRMLKSRAVAATNRVPARGISRAGPLDKTIGGQMSHARFTFGWWLELPFNLGDTWKRMTPRDAMTQQTCYWWHGSLEREPLRRMFPGAKAVELAILNAEKPDPVWSVTLYELNCLLIAQRAIRAKRVLEVGTYDGNTTLNMAANLPSDGVLVTIDLPPQEAEPELAFAVDPKLRNVAGRHVVGAEFRDRPEKRLIKQVLGDSAKLDWRALGGPFDLAFIDGCHAYDYVKSDTNNVLSVMRPGGVVMWHDYTSMEDVARAVDEFKGRFKTLAALQGTRLAVGIV